MQNVRSGRALDMRARRSTECQRALGFKDAYETKQDWANGYKRANRHAGLVWGASSQCKHGFMPNLLMNTRCSTECHGHPEGFASDQNFQIRVSLDDKEDGKVSLAKSETC